MHMPHVFESLTERRIFLVVVQLPLRVHTTGASFHYGVCQCGKNSIELTQICLPYQCIVLGGHTKVLVEAQISAAVFKKDAL